MVCSRIKAQVSESDLVTGRKWFLYSTGDSHIIFGPKGTGTLSKVVRKDGYAVQSMSGNARGSNQYQKKNKSYGATGGYHFTIEAKVLYKINWSFENGDLTVRLLPNPTI